MFHGLRSRLPELPARNDRARWDVQGLRAVAVTAVILDHLTGWPSGGFVGVDVFFVISGFLITGQLLRWAGADGVSFADFYRRRARRILPAATTMIVVTVGASYYLVNSAYGKTTLVDGVWAEFFMSNWHYALADTNYFANNASVSALQHTWSLAVEEQFYIFWPWVVIAFFAWAGTLRAAGSRLTWAVAFFCAGTFAYSTWHTAASPTWAYFSTLDRAWELGIGALLALLVPRLEAARASAVRPLLAWVGLAGIAASLVIINDSMAFPGPWAALPVLSTALVVAAGTKAEGLQQQWFWPMTNRATNYVGDVSYSLYLWHWPVIVLLPALIPDRGATFYVVAVLAMTFLSVACYHLIEKPIHHSNWLEPIGSRRDPWWRRTAWFIFPSRAQHTAVGALTIVAAFLVVGALRAAPPVSAESTIPLEVPSASAGADGPQTLADVQQERIAQALDAEKFPTKLSPGLEDLGFDNWQTQFVDAGFCTDEITDESLEDCSTGSGAKTAVVVGDSYAMAWLPGLAETLNAKGFRVVPLTMAECPAWDVKVTHGDGSAYPECEAHREWVADTVLGTDPELIILATADTTIRRIQPPVSGADATAAVEDGLASTMRDLAGSGARMVVLAPPPAAVSLQSCVTKFGSPSDCVQSIDSTWVDVSNGERAAAESAGAKYVDTSSWFCQADTAVCPGFIGSTSTRTDGYHLTIEASVELAPLITDALFSDQT